MPAGCKSSRSRRLSTFRCIGSASSRRWRDGHPAGAPDVPEQHAELRRRALGKQAQRHVRARWEENGGDRRRVRPRLLQPGRHPDPLYRLSDRHRRRLHQDQRGARAGKACRTSTAMSFSSPRTWLHSPSTPRRMARDPAATLPERRHQAATAILPPSRSIRRTTNAQAEHSLGRAVPRSRQGRRLSADAQLRKAFIAEVKATGDRAQLDFVISTATVDGWATRSPSTAGISATTARIRSCCGRTTASADARRQGVEHPRRGRQAQGPRRVHAAPRSQLCRCGVPALKGGFLSAVSVGFAPVKYAFSDEPGRSFGIDFLQQELLEFSVCPVPANPEALIEARSAGIDIAPIREWAVKLLAGENLALIDTARLAAISALPEEFAPTPRRRPAPKARAGSIAAAPIASNGLSRVRKRPPTPLCTPPNLSLTCL
jgi:hypothetical protein